MLVKLVNYLNAVELHIEACVSIRNAMDSVVPVFNACSADEQLELRSEIAKLIGKKKGVKPVEMEKGIYKGSLGFNAHGSEKEEQARVMLRYYMPTSVEKPSTKKVSKQVDRVAQRAKALKSDFTKAELRRLIALLSV